MKYLISLLMLFFALTGKCQWVITPDGTLTDSITGKSYMIIEREGSASELYDMVLKNVHTMFISPDDVVSTIENKIISVRGTTQTHLKYMGMNGLLEPTISVKIEFKDGRMKVSALWTSVSWMRQRPTDPNTLLTFGSLKCFNKKGEINNEKRYAIYNKVSRDFIDRLLNQTSPSDDDW